MSDFGGGSLDPSLRTSVGTDFSVPGDARVEGLNNQLSGLYDQRLSKTQSIAMKFDQLADLGAEIARLLSEIQSKNGEINAERAKGKDANPDKIAQLKSQIDQLKNQISRAKDKQHSVNNDIDRLRGDVQQLDGEIATKQNEISGAERDRDTQRSSKRATTEAQATAAREAEERLVRAARNAADSGKKVEIKLKLKDKVIEVGRESSQAVDTAAQLSNHAGERLTNDEMAVAWRDVSFKSMTTGQAIQLLTWSLGTMPELRAANENKFVATGPRNDGLLAP